MMTMPSRHQRIDQFLDDLVKELQISPNRYEQAENRYKSLGEWLNRAKSTVRDHNPDVYVQGSFCLGTAIKPASDEEDYDIDMVCCLDCDRTDLSQEELKRLVGIEIRSYAKQYGMSGPKDSRRCWTLNYAEKAHFHIDILPAVPDTVKRTRWRQTGKIPQKLCETALAITDKEHEDFRRASGEWPCSNPKGYAVWFRERMGNVFRRHAASIENTSTTNVEDVPAYRVRTPLQSAIQILKRHRDIMFSGRDEEKPVSILITTLAAHAYNQDETISDALLSILDGMDKSVFECDGVIWIQNPADPDENFADKWGEHPRRRDAFSRWLSQVRKDFRTVIHTAEMEDVASILSRAMGVDLINRIFERNHPEKAPNYPVSRVPPGNLILQPAHMRKPRWPHAQEGSVIVNRATYKSKSSAPRDFDSNGPFLPKGCELRFYAKTDITGRFNVYWQVVNTGSEAAAKNSLRGSFDFDSSAENQCLIRTESTLYRGTHSIECFIVKDGKLAARSGQFIVNIA